MQGLTNLLSAALVTALMASQPAFAKEASAEGNSEEQLQEKCKGKGIFIPKDRSSGTANPDSPYGCLGNNGSLIVCGGGTEQQKKTCTVSRAAAAERAMVRSRLKPTGR